MSAADAAAIAGTFLAAIITGLGLRRGEAERRGRPPTDRHPSPGASAGWDAGMARSILDEIRTLHADMAAWRMQDETERRADRDRTTVERFEQIEGNQVKILSLLRKIDAGEGARPDGGR